MVGKIGEVIAFEDADPDAEGSRFDAEFAETAGEGFRGEINGLGLVECLGELADGEASCVRLGEGTTDDRNKSAGKRIAV